MLNSGKKFRTLRNNKKKYSNSCVVRKNISERNKNLQVKWSVPNPLHPNKSSQCVKVAVSVFEHDMQGNDLSDLGDYCIVFENFTTSIGDLMVVN